MVTAPMRDGSRKALAAPLWAPFTVAGRKARADEVRKKLDCFKKEPAAIFDSAYAMLTILDAKAGGLMAINGLLATFLVLVAGYYKTLPNNTMNGMIVGASTILLAVLVASAILCFFIVRMKWGFMQRMNFDEMGTFNTEDEMNGLCDVILERTYLYECAWWLTLFCLVAILFMILVYDKS